MRLPPHRFTVKGKRWKLRYGDPDGDILDHDSDYGATVWAERLIYLAADMRLKRNRSVAWRTFAHELLHAHFPNMKHSRIALIEGPMGTILAELMGEGPAVPQGKAG